MKFDQGWGDESRFAQAANLPLVSDGRHTGEILSAQEKCLPFMQSETNKDGKALVLTVDISGFQPLEAIVPATFRGKIEAVARSAGVPIPVRGEEWDERQLVGRTVTIETALAVSPKSGKEYVRIERWHASPSKPLPPSRPASVARSPAAKAHKQFTANSTSNDDIPF